MAFACVLGTADLPAGAQGAPGAGRTRDVAVAASGNPAAPQSLREDLANADRLTIKFRGYPDLTGDYRVGIDEMISIPVVGRVSIAGLDSAGLEAELSRRTTKIAGRESYVTVEIAEYRPVFVNGFVQRPGATPWRPGLTVLQAVALSGGLYRSPEGQTVTPGGTRDPSRLRKAKDDQMRVLATLARMRAEQSSASTIEVPPALVALAGQGRAQALIDAQRAVLAATRTSLANQLLALKRGQDLASEELASLQAQLAKLEEQVKLRRQVLAKLQELLTKGVVRTDRVTDEVFRVSDLEEKITNVTVGIARVQGVLAGMRKDMVVLESDHASGLLNDIAKSERESAQLEIEIESARRLEDATPADTRKDDEGPSRVLSYEIVRGAAGTNIRADQFTALKPGDVLLISVRDN